MRGLGWGDSQASQVSAEMEYYEELLRYSKNVYRVCSLQTPCSVPLFTGGRAKSTTSHSSQIPARDSGASGTRVKGADRAKRPVSPVICRWPTLYKTATGRGNGFWGGVGQQTDGTHMQVPLQLPRELVGHLREGRRHCGPACPFSPELTACASCPGQLFPYHLSDFVTRVLRVTPFRYYCDVLYNALKVGQPMQAGGPSGINCPLDCPGLQRRR